MGWMEIIERLKQATGLTDKQVAALEKRGALRVSKRVSLIGLYERERVQMLAVDLSAKGLRVEASARMKKGDRVVIYKDNHHEGDKHRVNIDVLDDAPVATVVWCRRSRSGLHHDVGLEFLIDTAAQKKAVAHFLLGDCKVGLRDPREHRKAPRISSDMKAYVQTPDRTTYDATARDIAVGGALIIVGHPIERNTPVNVQVFLPGSKDALQGSGRVVRCTQVEVRKWELGIAFTQVNPDHRDRLVAALSSVLHTRASR
ncbi:MAG: PilZ domain-containing protein [Proteobacteria bacterium]|nr:PilZ domain-containing protein [Pseudomonadota bacterium]